MKLFVRNLSYDLNDEKLKEVFEEAGEVVSAKVITDPQTGRSRGFGFVEMSNGDEAKVAIEKLNGKEVGGRAIVVDKAHDKERSGGDRGGGDRGNRSGGDRGGNRGGPDRGGERRGNTGGRSTDRRR